MTGVSGFPVPGCGAVPVCKGKDVDLWPVYKAYLSTTCTSLIMVGKKRSLVG